MGPSTVNIYPSPGATCRSSRSPVTGHREAGATSPSAPPLCSQELETLGESLSACSPPGGGAESQPLAPLQLTWDSSQGLQPPLGIWFTAGTVDRGCGCQVCAHSSTSCSHLGAQTTAQQVWRGGPGGRGTRVALCSKHPFPSFLPSFEWTAPPRKGVGPLHGLGSSPSLGWSMQAGRFFGETLML